jgi:crossover junction endodeoxyribonuclease RuvC
MRYFIAIDPGMSGAVGVMSKDGTTTVFDVPTLKKKSGKEDYDIPGMSDILARYKGNDVVCMIEDVHAMPGQGVSSMFGFGRGKGIWEGIAGAFGFVVVMVSPQKWKKDYPALAAEKIPVKDTQGKTPKEKKEIAKALAKERRLAKAAAKSRARELAGSMFPQHADVLKTVNSDGRAEALLMASYIRRIYTKET